MAYTDQLSAPPASSYKQGYYTLNRFVRCEASVAAPTAFTNLDYIVQVDIGEPSYRVDVEIFEQGAGDERTKVRKGPRWDGTITVLGGKVGNVLASILGLTWGTANDAAVMLNRDNDYPVLIWEAVCRDADNVTHLFSLVIQDMIIDSKGLTNPLAYADEPIKFHTYHVPFLICPGSELVYDQFNGDGSTTTFTASSTPLTLTTASNYDDLDYNQIVYVKQKASGDSTGTRKKSGWSYSGGNFVATTAPAVSSTVQILYAKKIT